VSVDIKHRGRYPKLEGEDIGRLVQFRQAGYSCRQLESEFSCSRMAIWRALQRLGLE
jgi:biotin operon repressor